MAGLFDIFSNDHAENAAAMRNSGLQAGYDQLSSLYDTGRKALGENTNAGVGLYNNLITSYAPGASAYGDASGANGADGLKRATENFKNSGQYGAYGFSLDQGLQALNRTHAAAGNLNSGNADTDTLKFATGLAGQQYGNYLSGLQPYLNLNSNATMGAATLYGNQGNQLLSNLEKQGAAANTTQTGVGSSNAAAELNQYNVAGNLWNGLQSGVKLGAQLFGGF